jgi:hypothetical protein
VVGLKRQFVTGGARKPRANARRGHHAADSKTRDEGFQVRLSELVQVRIAGDVGERALVRNDRKLNQIVLGDEPIVDFEGERMNDIFGVVKNEDLVTLAGFHLFQLDGLHNPVQAIGLAGGARIRADHAMDLRSVESRAGDFKLGGFIVGIAAHKDVVVRVVETI